MMSECYQYRHSIVVAFRSREHTLRATQNPVVKACTAMKTSRLFLAIVVLLVCAVHAVAAVITSVVETGGDGAPTAQFTGNTFTGPAIGTYTVPTFGVLAKCFTDRVHAWTNASGTILIPSYLVGQEYIMIRNDNRDNNGGLNGGSAGLYRLDVTISSPARVYLLIDNRLGDGSGATPPTFSATNMAWVTAEGWAPVTNGINRNSNINVPDEVGVEEAVDGDIDQWSSIYVKMFAPGTFTLKEPNNTGRNMYGVVVEAAGPNEPPSAPTNLVAVAGDAQVTLTWAAASGATGYNIKRAPGTGGPYITIGTAAGTSFVDSGLVNGIDYFYVVSGTNSLGEGPDSNEAFARPNIVVTGISAIGGTNQVTVSWNALAGAASYSVLRSTTSNGTYTAVASGITGTTHVDTTAQNGNTYFYRVTAALTAGGESGQSEAVSAITAPTPPTLTAALWASTVQRISWTTNNPAVSQFFLESSTDGVNFTPLATLPANQPSYTNIGLSLGTTYYYRVQAQNAVGLSAYSGVASNTTPAFGINVNFALAAAPEPPGYVEDSGAVYGDRGNGMTYGWDRDITVDARQRNSVNSPDLRYDTFNHLIKATPPAIWNIAIPNGFYSVRVVAGDPDNTDSVFQHNIEGALTATVNPGGPGSFRNNWADYTLEVGVSDGQLTITSGPNSQTLANNNKISFVDVYPAVPTPPSFTAQPQNVTVEQNRPASLSATAAGSAVLQYQWYLNNTAVPNGTNSTLAFARPQPGDSGSYYLVVTNYGGVATSAVVTLTVTPDNSAPYIASAISLDGASIGLCFSEELDNSQNVVTEAGNYQINDGSGAFVLTATLRADGRSVNLLLSAPVTGPFTIASFTQRDLAGNLAATTETNGTVLGFTTGDVGAVGFPGSHFTCDGNEVEVVGGGADIWGAADQGYLVTKSASGDFDARIRVPSLRGSNAITKAVLVARESRSADSAGFHISVNPPPPGRNQTEMALRPTTGAATVAVGSSFIPAGVPNAWMRITRIGNVFTGYRSTNGVNWIQLGQTNFTLPTDLVVGYGVTAHDNTLLATGVLSGFTLSQEASDLAVSKVASPDPVNVGGNVTYTITVTNLGPGVAVGAQLTDALPAGLSFVSVTTSQGSGGNSGNSVTANLGTIPALGSATVTIVATATNAGSITNTAVAVNGGLETNLANNSATVVTTVNSASSQQPIVNVSYTPGGGFTGAIQTQNGITYTVQYKNDLNAPSWSTLTTFIGDGTVKTFNDPAPGVPMRFYRVTVCMVCAFN
jgi:uncharacterized repeat protein (TIGR01451 family)